MKKPKALLCYVLVLMVIFCSIMSTFTIEGNAKGASTSTDDKIQMADTLLKLNLFRGTDNGYELEQSFTRAQGAVMLLRLFGLE
ncbi:MULTISPECIES: hypothetical protein [unclassified Paenibacillus]|uniref:hypothetical protein n=1 Tax=unclassified Paenibacillus TaxID=185978 RepID=UPI0036336BE1